jgi:hypothetical protein
LRVLDEPVGGNHSSGTATAAHRGVIVS